MNHTHVALLALFVSSSVVIASENNNQPISTSLATLQAGGISTAIVSGNPTVTSYLLGKGIMAAKGIGTALVSPVGLTVLGASALAHYSLRNIKPENKENS